VTNATIKNINFLEAMISLLLKKQFRPIITVPHAVIAAIPTSLRIEARDARYF
jgi:hypothetical protein